MSDSPARHFNLAGASNFRDLGGYPGTSGRMVRWRQIFRSNHLGHLTEADTDALDVMRDSYRNYVRHNTPSFRALFAHLLEDRAPLVIHCTAGKDRTGFACALILHALGVPDEVISEDYLLTNRFYRRDPRASSDLPDEVSQVLGSVQTSFLAAAFDAISSEYGNLETYFGDGLGLGTGERAELRARYLES
jgi:protein-tyrosine phosphatase